MRTGRRPATLYIKPSKHVRTITPPWPDTQPLAPDDLFITSGDAVMKTRQLRREIHDLYRRILTLPPEHPFCTECRQALDETDKLMTLLLKAKGKAIFLECEWEEGQVRCMAKNPRAREPIDQN